MTDADRITSRGSPAEIVRRLQAICDQYDISAIRQHLDAFISMLEDGDFIDVGIFGRFKAGKSSILNLLADKTILPVGVTPVTTVVTCLRYGPQEQASVQYLKGRTEAIPIESAKSYVAESENPQNVKGVSSVNIELPLLNSYNCLKHYSYLRFVDTPGLESVFQHNTDLLWLVIPMTIFRSWVNGHFLNRIPYETEKNLSRLASQWTEKINDGILKMQRDAEQHVHNQISTVESLLSRTPSDTEGIRMSLLEVESFKCAVPS